MQKIPLEEINGHDAMPTGVRLFPNANELLGTDFEGLLFRNTRIGDSVKALGVECSVVRLGDGTPVWDAVVTARRKLIYLYTHIRRTHIYII